MGSGNVVRKFLIICYSIATGLAATGCLIRNPVYPQAWSQIELPKDTEALAVGSYRCIGESNLLADEKINYKTVAELLYGYKNKDYPNCEVLTIRKLSTTEMEFSFINHGESIKRSVLRKGKDYHVEGNWIVLDATGFFLAEDIVAVYAHTRSYLTKNAQGDLIIKSKGWAFGTILLVVPIGVVGTEWVRFKQAVNGLGDR